MIKGYADARGTEGYFKEKAHKFKEPVVDKGYFRSPFTLGTYLGDFSDEDSILYRESIEYALLNGINSIDTAVNYRGMRSERDIGHVLNKLIKNEKLKRNEVIISSKGGIVPGDGQIMHKPIDYIEDYLIGPGLITVDDYHMYENLRLSMHPNYFEYVLDLSRSHLNIETIDIYYFHLPELSLAILGKEEFYMRLKVLFEYFESKVQSGCIKSYGIATWDGLLLKEDHEMYLDLETLMTFIDENRFISFKHIMVPFNLVNQKAVTLKNQRGQSFMTRAKEYKLIIHSSASVNRAEADYCIKDYIDFIRTSQVNDPIVGCRQVMHLKENIDLFSE